MTFKAGLFACLLGAQGKYSPIMILCEAASTLCGDAESAMARKNPTSDILFDDAVLKMSRRKGGIDYLHWLDDIDSLRAKVPRSTRRGYWARLDDVRPADLMSLPDKALARPVTLAEMSVDFIPKGVTSVQQQARILIDTYRVLFRRLTSWKGPFIGTRIYCSNGREVDARTLLDNRRSMRCDDKTGQWLFSEPEYDAGDDELLPLVADRDVPYVIAVNEEFEHCFTIYFGHKVYPSWPYASKAYKPNAQVRLYIKVTDNGKKLPRQQWCVRVEVTLNGPALQEVLGVSTLGGLQGAKLQRLVPLYMQLCRAEPATHRRSVPKALTRSAPYRALLAGEYRHAEQVARSATRNGNLTAIKSEAVNFKPTDLTKYLTSSMVEYVRACARKRRK